MNKQSMLELDGTLYAIPTNVAVYLAKLHVSCFGAVTQFHDEHKHAGNLEDCPNRVCKRNIKLLLRVSQ